MSKEDLILAHITKGQTGELGYNCASASCQSLIDVPLPELYQKALLTGHLNIPQIAVLAGKLLYDAGYYCTEIVIEEDQTPASFFKGMHKIKHVDPHIMFFGGLIQANLFDPQTLPIQAHVIAVTSVHDNNTATIVDITHNPPIREIKLSTLNQLTWPRDVQLQIKDHPPIEFTRALALVGEPIGGRFTHNPVHHQRRYYMLKAVHSQLAELSQTFITDALQEQQ